MATHAHEGPRGGKARWESRCNSHLRLSGLHAGSLDGPPLMSDRFWYTL